MLHAYWLTDSGGVELIADDDIHAAVRVRERHCWIDIASTEPTVLDPWFETLAVPEIVLGVVADGDATRAAAIANVAYFSFPFLQADVRKDPIQIVGISVDGALLTFHDGPIDALESAWDRITAAEFLVAPTVSAMVCALCGHAATQSQVQSRELRKMVAELEERLDRRRVELDIAEIIAFEAIADRCAASVEEQMFCFQSLESAHTRALDLVEIASDFDVPIGTANFVDRVMDRLERRVRGLRGRYDMMLGEKTNRRLGFLTVISAVFLPITLIAGIYGMNFDNIPELHWPGAYPGILGVMALVAAGMLWLFWRKGWFD